MRFRVEAKLAGKVYGARFGVDIGFGDPLVGETETMTAEDTLGFAGIAPPTLRLYPLEAHIAEKLHAYSLPRPRPNSRVKDLPDLALLGTVRALEARTLRAALERTFAFRHTHELPQALPEPPSSWAGPYAEMAQDNDLPWPDLAAVTEAARRFLDPVLVAGLEALRWDPATRTWQPM